MLSNYKLYKVVAPSKQHAEKAYYISPEGEVVMVQKLRQYVGAMGYPQYNIRGVTTNTHRILAETFIPNPDNLEMVNHKDGNKENNSLDNLEWCSREYNCQHAWAHGLCEPIRERARENIIKNNKKRWAK